MASIKRIGKDDSGITIWNVYYRRTPGGRVVHRRVTAATKAEAERIIALDSNRSDVSLKWSEGLKIYVEAKRLEGRNPEGIGHAERAVAVFAEVVGDIPIERTDPDTLKHFMRLVSAGVTVHDITGKEYRTAGPSVANHHRKELVTVARYLLRHSGKIQSIPFLNVPPLPLRTVKRAPIAEGEVTAYLDALQPHVWRPVMLVLLYGLRSTAICNLTPESVKASHLIAVDKGNVEHRIVIDDMLSGIIKDALAFRETFDKPADRLFVNKAGLAWNRTSLLRAAQRFWESAGLEKKKVHEVRHTLGTVAGKYFPVGMVQAAMRHQSRQSSETYFHPNEDMAVEVRQKIVAELLQNFPKAPKNAPTPPTIAFNKNGEYECPCCHSKLLISKEKGRKSK